MILEATIFYVILGSQFTLFFLYDGVVRRLACEDQQLWLSLGRPGLFFGKLENVTVFAGGPARRRLVLKLVTWRLNFPFAKTMVFAIRLCAVTSLLSIAILCILLIR